MLELHIKTPTVSVDWLYTNLNATNLVILDASMPKVTDSESDETTIQIPKTRFFDIKNVFSNTEDPFPNAVPSEAQFNRASQQLGLNNTSAIVVYDDKGIYSSARVWWLYKAFGHHNIAVLDGGLPEWLEKGYPTENKQNHNVELGDFQGIYNPEYFKFFDDIQESINTKNDIILDARSEERFNGLVKEPRAGLRSGHIPNSKNLPHSKLMDGNKLKSDVELKLIFNTFKEDNLIFSCGSGITACILALGAEIAGCKNLSVYDGSWTEYGSLTPKVMTPNWTKKELVAYILLYASHSDLLESNKERNIIISKVDVKTFDKIHKEFEGDNDYKSIQKIMAGLKAHRYSKMDIDLLLADIKVLFFADGDYGSTEQNIFMFLKRMFQ